MIRFYEVQDLYLWITTFFSISSEHQLKTNIGLFFSFMLCLGHGSASPPQPLQRASHPSNGLFVLAFPLYSVSQWKSFLMGPDRDQPAVTNYTPIPPLGSRDACPWVTTMQHGVQQQNCCVCFGLLLNNLSLKVLSFRTIWQGEMDGHISPLFLFLHPLDDLHDYRGYVVAIISGVMRLSETDQLICHLKS